MPQFDISSFQVQIVWCLILLGIMSILISYKFLPNTLFSIKIRGNLYTQKPSATYTPTLMPGSNRMPAGVRIFEAEKQTFYRNLEDYRV